MLWYLKPFHWKYSSVFGIALFFAGIPIMLADKYFAAFVFYALGGLWMVGWWLVEHPAPGRREGQTQWTAGQKRTLRKRWLGTVPWVLITAVMLLWTATLKNQHELDLLYGALVPANDIDPKTFCDDIAKPSDLKLVIGNTTVLAKKFPLTVIAFVDRDTEKMLASLIRLDRDESGRIEVTSDVFNDEGKLIARISKNELTVSESKIFRTHKERPDVSTLDVQNEYGERALYIRYLNPRSVKFLGKLYYRPIPSVGFIIEDDKAYTVGLAPGDVLGHNCLAFDSSATSIAIAFPSQQAATKKALPELKTEIAQVADGHFFRNQDDNLVLAVSISNTGEPTTISGWDLHVYDGNGQEHKTQGIYLPAGHNNIDAQFGTFTQVWSGDDDLAQKLAASQIGRNKNEVGILAFQVLGVPQISKGFELRLYCQDITGKKYETRYVLSGDMPKNLHVPGLSKY